MRSASCRHGAGRPDHPVRGEADRTRRSWTRLRVDWSSGRGARGAGGPGRAPGLHGHLRLQPRGPGRRPRGYRGRLRQARHPALIDIHRVYAYLFQGYWEDIGTIRSFYEANLDLCEPLPKFNFYDATAPIFTHARYLPGTKIIGGRMERSVIADGCIINDARHRALVDRGPRSRIEAGATIRDSLVMGAGLLRDARPQPAGGAPRRSASGTAPASSGTIVDKNARIGDRCPDLARRASRRTSTGPTSTCATGSW